MTVVEVGRVEDWAGVTVVGVGRVENLVEEVGTVENWAGASVAGNPVVAAVEDTGIQSVFPVEAEVGTRWTAAVDSRTDSGMT